MSHTACIAPLTAFTCVHCHSDEAVAFVEQFVSANDLDAGGGEYPDVPEGERLDDTHDNTADGIRTYGGDAPSRPTPALDRAEVVAFPFSTHALRFAGSICRQPTSVVAESNSK